MFYEKKYFGINDQIKFLFRNFKTNVYILQGHKLHQEVSRDEKSLPVT